MNNDVKKRIKFKHGLIQRSFWVISVIFLVIVIIYFSIRFVVISKIYSDADMTATEYIFKNFTEDKGLYQDGDLYVFRGNIESNYLRYGNLLFRIVKIYKDGSMEVIMNDGINALYYNDEYSSYLESDIHKYLNDQVLELLDKNDLNRSPICVDIVSDIENITCNQVDYSSYVKLLMVGDYVNSILNEETYIGGEGEYFWLGNVSTDKVWNTDGSKLSLSDVRKGHKIKPVITLNEMVKYLGGRGSKDNPIVVKESVVGINSYVKINNDLYIVIDRDKSYLKMMLVEDSPFVRDTISDNLLEELNNEYYDNLSYKDKLVRYTIDTGKYKKSYNDIVDEKESVYVGIPTISDFKLDNGDYLLINTFDGENGYYYNNELYLNDVSLARKIRPVVVIKMQEISSGSGLIDDPYIVEVQ